MILPQHLIDELITIMQEEFAISLTLEETNELADGLISLATLASTRKVSPS